MGTDRKDAELVERRKKEIEIDHQIEVGTRRNYEKAEVMRNQNLQISNKELGEKI